MDHSDQLLRFDNDSIGREFAAVSLSTADERRRHASRRAKLLLQEWQQTFSDSCEPVSKSRLQNACRFDTRKAHADSIMTWIVTLTVAAVAGIICAVVIRHLNL